MSLKNVGSVKGLLERGSSARTKGTRHGTAVVGESVAVFVVLPGKTLYVILTRYDGALLGAFLLVRKHVGGEVTEDAAAVRVRASRTVLDWPSRRADAVDWDRRFDRGRRELCWNGCRREPRRFGHR